MEEDTKLRQRGAANGAALTASVGNHGMVTYMKMAGVEDAAPSGGTGSPSTDLNFLDGLFDNSGSSDNGSDKGSDKGGQAALGYGDEGGTGTGTGNTAISINMLNSSTNNASESHDVATAATIDSVDASMKPVVLPVNPLLSHQQQQHHASRPQQVLTNNLHHPGKPTTLQQHVENEGGAQRGGESGAGNDQSNNATRTMSDVSSLTSSCGDGNTSPNLPYQSNEPTRPFATMSYQQSNNNGSSNVNANQQKNQSFQSWGNKVTFDTNQAHQQHMQQNIQSLQQQQQRQIQQQPSHIFPETTKLGSRKRRSESIHVTSSSKPFSNTVPEDEDEAQKRRRDRNLREQERSQRISNQILQLKELLAASNVPFKPDKYSTLVSVHGYIKSLQQHVALIDEEQKKLVETISKTNDLVTKAQHGPNSVQSTTATETMNQDGSPQLIPSSNVQVDEEEEELLKIIRGVDYKNAFSRMNVALCVTRIDGKLIDCNEEFVRIFGLSIDTLVKAGLRKPRPKDVTSQLIELYGKQQISLFNLISREDMRMLFEAMSTMLSNEIEQNAFKNAYSSKNDHWAAVLRCNTVRRFQFNISLVRKKDGTPNFFNCALVPVSEITEIT